MEVHIFMNKKGRKQKKYVEHFKNTNDFIQKLNDYIYYYNNDRISQIKRNESCAIQNSFLHILIFFCLFFGVHFNAVLFL